MRVMFNRGRTWVWFAEPWQLLYNRTKPLLSDWPRSTAAAHPPHPPLAPHHPLPHPVGVGTMSLVVVVVTGAKRVPSAPPHCRSVHGGTPHMCLGIGQMRIRNRVKVCVCAMVCVCVMVCVCMCVCDGAYIYTHICHCCKFTTFPHPDLPSLTHTRIHPRPYSRTHTRIYTLAHTYAHTLALTHSVTPPPDSLTHGTLALIRTHTRPY